MLLLDLDRWNVAEGAVQADVVEPVHPGQGGQLEVLDAAPRPVAAGALGFVQPDEAFGLCIEVFSTDWSFGGGEDKRCGDDGTDSSWAESDSVQGLPAGLEQGDAAFAWSA